MRGVPRITESTPITAQYPTPPTLVLFIQHILHIRRRVDLRSRNIVPLEAGVQEGMTADPGVGIQRTEA
jgi:hypothetical protein